MNVYICVFTIACDDFIAQDIVCSLAFIIALISYIKYDHCGQLYLSISNYPTLTSLQMNHTEVFTSLLRSYKKMFLPCAHVYSQMHTYSHRITHMYIPSIKLVLITIMI